MIQFIGVNKTYATKDSDLTALEDISFDIDEGEFVFLIGPSGSGKTTLIKLLIREESPTNGKIYFDEEEVTSLNRNGVYQLRRKIGVIFQDYKLIEDKTAYENIEFVMQAAGKTTKEIDETVPYLLDIVGLADRTDSFPRELSGGEKQRVAIARALANNPKLLIADEPTGNLDPEAAWDIVQILQKINDWGTTVIMSTHGSEIVDKIGKRVIEMQNGILVRDDKLGSYKSKAEDSTENFEEKIVKETTEDKTTSEENTTKEKTTKEESEKKDENEKTKSKEQIDEKKKEKSEVEDVKEGQNTKEQQKETIAEESIKVDLQTVQNEENKTDTKDDSDEKVDVEIKKDSSDEKKNLEKPVKEKKQPKFKISLVHKKDEKKKKTVIEKDKPLFATELPGKIVETLEQNGVKTVDQLKLLAEEDLKKMENIDGTDVGIINNYLINFKD